MGKSEDLFTSDKIEFETWHCGTWHIIYFSGKIKNENRKKAKSTNFGKYLASNLASLFNTIS